MVTTTSRLKLSSFYVVLTLGLAVTGCNRGIGGTTSTRGPESTGDEIPRIQTVSVEARDLEQSIQLPGTVKGNETADLYAKVGGYLESISVDIGDRVDKGQVVAILSIPEMQKELRQKELSISTAEADVKQALAAIRQAESKVKSAEAGVEEANSELGEKKSQSDFRKAEYDRIKGLVDRNSVNSELLDEVTYRRSAAEAAVKAVGARIRTAEALLEAATVDVEKAKTDHDRTLAYVELAKANFERVQTMAGYASIRAPFSGVITKRMVDPGAFIQPAEGNSAAKPLLTITSTKIVRIWLDLPMGQVRWLNKGDTAVLDRINVLPGETFTGEVTRYATALDRDSRMMRVEVDLDNPDNKLMPGYYGYIRLQLEKFPKTPVVPSSAILSEGNNLFVFVVEDNICHKRPIVTNYQDGSIVGIESGVTVGEEVVQAGGGQLSDGQKVSAVNKTQE